MDALVVLLGGWGLDLLLGDPQRLPHPIVGMGRWIIWGERLLNRGSHRRAKGALLAAGSVAMIFCLASLLLGWLKQETHIAWMGASLIGVFFCLAGHTLRKEVRLVFQTVDRSLPEGRRQVARIVGRDTRELSAQEVRTAALETLAENLSDGVVAPLFWYALLGLPGMLAYKMTNTLDSMIGYRNARYRDFGCWAARIDDAANYLPARLTALLLLVADGRWMRGDFSLFSFVKTFASCHASPNSGWPESALAGLLDCRFGGPHRYFGEVFDKPYIGTNPRALHAEDLRRSLGVSLRAEVFAVVLTCALLAGACLTA